MPGNIYINMASSFVLLTTISTRSRSGSEPIFSGSLWPYTTWGHTPYFTSWPIIFFADYINYFTVWFICLCVSVFVNLFYLCCVSYFLLLTECFEMRFKILRFLFRCFFFTICYSLELWIYCFAKKTRLERVRLSDFFSFDQNFKESREIFSAVSVFLYVCMCPCLSRYGSVTEYAQSHGYWLLDSILKVIDLVIVKVNVVQRLVSLQRLEVHLVA